MPKKERIVRHSAEALAEKRARHGSRSDWARAAGMTAAEIEADIASDPDEAGMVVDWSKVSVELPQLGIRSTPKSPSICVPTTPYSSMFVIISAISSPSKMRRHGLRDYAPEDDPIDPPRKADRVAASAGIIGFIL